MEQHKLTDLRALTVIQPWATYLADGTKQYETRSWSTNIAGRLQFTRH